MILEIRKQKIMEKNFENRNLKKYLNFEIINNKYFD